MTSAPCGIYDMAGESIDEVDSQGTDRSPSTISDCYSNDGDYIEYFDNICRNPIDNQKSETANHNAVVITENFDKDYFIHKDLIGAHSDRQVSEKDSAIKVSHDNLDMSNFWVDYDSTTRYKGKLSNLNNNQILNDSAVLFRDDSDCETERVPSSGVSFRHDIDLQLRQAEIFEPFENNISDSLFDFSNNGDSECKITLKGRSQHGKVSLIKNVSHHSRKDQILKERTTQTIIRTNKEVGMGTSDYFKNMEAESLRKKTTEQQKVIHCRKQDSLDIKDDVQNMSIETTMDSLMQHVSHLISTTESPYRNGYSLFVDRVSKTNRYEDNNEQLINNLYLQIKHIYSLLYSKLNSNKNEHPEPTKHQRRYSERIQNKVCIHEGGDIPSNCNYSESAFIPNDNQIGNKKVITMADFGEIDKDDGLTCRIFELNPYDNLVKSYQSHTDRRIKAVANKMKCQINITGPICIYDTSNSCWNSRNKTSFQCAIKGDAKESVEKCVKCLKDTFPQSCLNEKRIICKLNSKGYIL